MSQPKTIPHAEEKRGFYVHLAVYLLVNALLAGLDLSLSPERLWFYWPLMGWGIGVLAHAAAVFHWFGGKPQRLPVHRTHHR